MRINLISPLLSLFISLMAAAHACAVPQPELGQTYAVCGIVFIRTAHGSETLNSFTNQRTVVPDGVYRTIEPWCLYSIKSGIARQISTDGE